MMSKYLSCREYAEMHGVSPQAVRKMIADNRIEGARSIKLPGPARANDHVWIIPYDAKYIKRRPGRKPGSNPVRKIAEEYSDDA